MNTEIQIVPHDPEIEEAVIGALLLSAENHLIAELTEDSFFSEKHREIFAAMHELYSNADAVDLITVFGKIKTRTKTISLFDISKITNRITQTTNTAKHIAILRQLEVKRKTIIAAGKLMKQGYDQAVDAFSCLNDAILNIADISSGVLRRRTKNVQQIMRESVEEMKSLNGGLAGVTSGIADLDKITLGFEKTNFHILAARPGMGKTALAIQMACHIAKQGKDVLFASLEMSEKQLNKRIQSSLTGIALEKIRRNTLTDHEWEKIHQVMELSWLKHLHITDQSGASPIELMADAQRIAATGNLGAIFVDYLQLMKGTGDNREGQISHISRSLKNMAKDFDVPVIAMAQLNREVEKRRDKKPKLSDLRESGSIEQDADVVIFQYRPDYYGITENEDGFDLRGVTELIVSKNRHGNLGEALIRFDGAHMKFTGL